VPGDKVEHALLELPIEYRGSPVKLEERGKQEKDEK
jgi:hypothetical protein